MILLLGTVIVPGLGADLPAMSSNGMCVQIKLSTFNCLSKLITKPLFEPEKISLIKNNDALLELNN